MFKKLPVKNEYLLIAASVILILLGYKLAFKATVDAWQTNRQLKAQLNQSASLSYQPGYLQRKSVNLDKVIQLYKADTVAFRNNSISTIAGIAEKNNVKLSEVPTRDVFYHTDKFIVEKLGFEGDFFSLTKVLDQLQLTNNIGIIRSVSYKAIDERSGKSDDRKLVLQIYLEIVI